MEKDTKLLQRAFLKHFIYLLINQRDRNSTS